MDGKPARQRQFPSGLALQSSCPAIRATHESSSQRTDFRVESADSLSAGQQASRGTSASSGRQAASSQRRQAAVRSGHCSVRRIPRPNQVGQSGLPARHAAGPVGSRPPPHAAQPSSAKQRSQRVCTQQTTVSGKQARHSIHSVWRRPPINLFAPYR